MPGTIIFKPIEAKLIRSTEVVGNMNPYCLIRAGNQNFSGKVCKEGGSNPHWNDEITVPIPCDNNIFEVLIRDDNIMMEEDVGSIKLDLNKKIQQQGQERTWYPLYHNNEPVGELLLETSLVPQPLSAIQDPRTQQEQKTIPGTFSSLSQNKTDYENRTGAVGKEIYQSSLGGQPDYSGAAYM